MDTKSYKEYLHQITTFVFDVDGVLTNKYVIITTDGQLLRTMNTKDGYALKTAVDKGYNVCIISGGSNEGVRFRLRALGITDIYMGSHHKAEELDRYLDVYGIAPQHVLYMGDDIPDLPAMEMVAVASCPQDAVQEVKNASLYVSHKRGGQGCVRDIIEQVLKVQGKWAADTEAKYD